MFPSTEHYTAFKRQLGHTNHDLVTILIGLEAIGAGKVSKPSNFSVNWNPKDIKASATRARRFARMATVAWAVDCLDFYIYNVAKETCYLSRPASFDEIPETKSVFVRLKTFQEYFALKTDIPLSLTHLMIQWRNNLLHSSAENKLDAVYSGKLKNATDKELENFRHLDCHMMLENFKKGEVPTLKEVGGAVQAINLIAGTLDHHIGALVDWPLNYDRRLRRLVATQRSLVKKIWSERDLIVRSRSIKMLISTAGIASKAPSKFFDNYVTSLEALTVESAVDRFSSDSVKTSGLESVLPGMIRRDR